MTANHTKDQWRKKTHATTNYQFNKQHNPKHNENSKWNFGNMQRNLKKRRKLMPLWNQTLATRTCWNTLDDAQPWQHRETKRAHLNNPNSMATTKNTTANAKVMIRTTFLFWCCTTQTWRRNFILQMHFPIYMNLYMYIRWLDFIPAPRRPRPPANEDPLSDLKPESGQDL